MINKNQEYDKKLDLTGTGQNKVHIFYLLCNTRTQNFRKHFGQIRIHKMENEKHDHDPKIYKHDPEDRSNNESMIRNKKFKT